MTGKKSLYSEMFWKTIIEILWKHYEMYMLEYFVKKNLYSSLRKKCPYSELF